MDDFEKYIDKSREKNPSEFQIKKWKKAVQMANVSTMKPRPSKTIYWGQMIAAVLVGVVIGGLLFSDLNQSKGPEVSDIAYEDATIEVVYTKL